MSKTSTQYEMIGSHSFRPLTIRPITFRPVRKEQNEKNVGQNKWDEM